MKNKKKINKMKKIEFDELVDNLPMEQRDILLHLYNNPLWYGYLSERAYREIVKDSHCLIQK